MFAHARIRVFQQMSTVNKFVIVAYVCICNRISIKIGYSVYRKTILEYFGEDTSNLQMRANCCDNCAKGLSSWALKDLYVGVDNQGLYNFARDAELVLNAINCMEMLDLKPTQKCVMKLMKGVGYGRLATLPHFGIGRQKHIYYWYAMVDQLMFAEYIDYVAGETYLRLTAKAEIWRLQPAPKALRLKPMGAVYNFIQIKPSTPLIRTESNNEMYRYRSYHRNYYHNRNHFGGSYFGG